LQVDIENMTRSELLEKVKKFYAHPEAALYFALQEQLTNLSEKIETSEIDFGNSDDDSFDDYMKIAKESVNISRNLKELRALIDVDTMRKEQEKRKSSKKGSYEDYAKRHGKK